jgi:hypothetical protein
MFASIGLLRRKFATITVGGPAVQTLTTSFFVAAQFEAALRVKVAGSYEA